MDVGKKVLVVWSLRQAGYNTPSNFQELLVYEYTSGAINLKYYLIKSTYYNNCKPTNRVYLVMQLGITHW